MAKSKRAANPGDLYAEVNQTACNKLLNSVTYPFTVFEHSQSFPGCSGLAAGSHEALYEYTRPEITKMLNDAVDQSHSSARINDEIYSFGGSIVEQAKKAYDATGNDGYVGPKKEYLEKIYKGGIKGLMKNLDAPIGLYGFCSYLKVVIPPPAPDISLASTRINLKGIKLSITATGELWAVYPWFNCYEWCLKWREVTKCSRILSVTPTLKIDADAHAEISHSGTIVTVQGVFDSLVLDYDILDKIQLAGLANAVLGKQLVSAYDVGKLVETVPVLNSSFVVDTIDLPPTVGGIGVAVTVKQIPKPKRKH